MMNSQEMDLLLGRLAVHFQVLTKEQVAEAMRWRRESGSPLELGQFLVAEGFVAPDVFAKLERARQQYLQKQAAEAPATAGAPPAPANVPVAAPAPATAMPVAPNFGPSPLVFAASPPAVGADTKPIAAQPFAAEPPEIQLPGGDATPAFQIEALPTPFDEPAAAAPAFAAPSPAFAPAPPPPVQAPAPVPMQAAPVPAPPAQAPPVQAQAPPAHTQTPPAQAQAPPAAPAAHKLTLATYEAVATPLMAAHSYVPDGGFRIQYDRRRTLDDLLTQAARVGASDLHVHSMAPLRIRMNGRMEDASAELIDPAHARSIIWPILNDEQRAQLEDRMQLDFAYTLPGVGRFRANAYQQQRGLDAVFRIIPEQPPTLADLGMPENLQRVIQYHQGMVLFTGPAGCGKSSTMAAMVRLVNESRPDHIITVEDPIEYVHKSAACLVNQRQVGPHTGSFARALRAALREDPDVIVIGELRDLETISLALTAAETGHLVFGTLHTSSAIRTVNRLLGVFPPEQQAQIRTMVSESLRAVVSQRLLVKVDGSGRVPAIEVMINNKAVGNLIRESKTFQIPSAIQTGASAGMIGLDASLLELVKSGMVTMDEARRQAEDPKKFT